LEASLNRLPRTRKFEVAHPSRHCSEEQVPAGLDAPCPIGTLDLACPAPVVDFVVHEFRDSPAFRPAGIAPQINRLPDFPRSPTYTLTPGQPSPAQGGCRALAGTTSDHGSPLLLRICLEELATRFDAATPSPRRPYPPVCHPAQTRFGWYRNTNRLSIAYAPFDRGLGIGPTNPTRTTQPSEPLGSRCACFAQALRYSYRHSHFAPLQPASRWTFLAGERSPTTWRACGQPCGCPLPRHIRSVGDRLEPRSIVGAGSLDQ
jgi:hypothetical protein